MDSQNLQPLIDFSKEKSKHIMELVKGYRNREHSLIVFSELSGNSLLQTWINLSLDSTLGIFMAQGDYDEQDGEYLLCEKQKKSY